MDDIDGVEGDDNDNSWTSKGGRNILLHWGSGCSAVQ
jgi:hypothetical protein